MNSQLNNTQKTMAAVTFAEAGEWNTAREFLSMAISKVKLSLWDSIFAAAAFAEEGHHDAAQQIMAGEPQKRSRRAPLDLSDLGIGKLHLVYGTVAVEA